MNRDVVVALFVCNAENFLCVYMSTADERKEEIKRPPSIASTQFIDELDERSAPFERLQKNLDVPD